LKVLFQTVTDTIQTKKSLLSQIKELTNDFDLNIRKIQNGITEDQDQSKYL